MNAKENWVVEVSGSGDDDGWVRVAETSESSTAIAIADAIHSLMQTGIVGRTLFQVRTSGASGEA